MVTSATWERRDLFSNDRRALILIDTLRHHQGTASLWHEFVVMPDHIPVLLTPKTRLKKAVQFIRGGFSFRAKKELGSIMEVGQNGFSDHRILDAGDHLQPIAHIRQNPVRKHLCEQPEDYLFRSSRCGFELAPGPPGLKPVLDDGSYGAAEAAPFPSNGNGKVERNFDGNLEGNFDGNLTTNNQDHAPDERGSELPTNKPQRSEPETAQNAPRKIAS
jgi:putative transposase